jgi:hypothetical protein
LKLNIQIITTPDSTQMNQIKPERTIRLQKLRKTPDNPPNSTIAIGIHQQTYYHCSIAHVEDHQIQMKQPTPQITIRIGM